MSYMKEDLINKIVEELKSEKVTRIPFMIAPLEQNLDDEQFKDFLNDLESKDFYVRYEEDDTEGWTNGKINISLELKHEEDYVEDEYSYYDNDKYYVNYTYEIKFNYDERYWGYCQCGEDDKDYDPRYDCCGHGCDWKAPSFYITKHESIGGISWQGDQHAFWDFQDRFNNVDDKEKEEAKKKAEIRRIEEQIEYYTKQLEKAKNS